jgi:lipoprotein-anchoring transpeptidase ErfK/SrfK
MLLAGLPLLLGVLPTSAPPLLSQLPVLRRGAEGDMVALLQVALGNQEFSAGAIDGRFSPALAAALVDYQKSRGLAPDGIAGPVVWGELGIARVNGEEAFRAHTVTPADTAGLAPLPEAWEARAELEVLPYETALERLAERYQTAPEYLVSLNPRAGWPNPPPGAALRVPAVEFETAVGIVLPYRRARVVVGEEVAGGDSAGGVSTKAVPAEGADLAAPADSLELAVRRQREADSIGVALADSAVGALRAQWERHAPQGVSVRVSTRDRVVRVYEEDRLVARYPATVGSRQFPNPEGEWKIVSQVYAPDYRYDETYLETGRRSQEALRISPGPNNIVGLMWLGLDKEGFGLHGTDEPGTIGASASHGCVRLTNWDAERLARRVGIGTPVTISS